MGTRFIAATAASSVAAAAIIAFFLTQSSPLKAETAAAAPPPPHVSVAAVSFKPLRQWAELTGRLEAVDTVAIQPRVGGYIDSVAFAEGAEVQQGQLLFQIDPRPFQAEVDRLEAEVSSSQAKLELATAERERDERLSAQNAVTQRDLDRFRAGEKSAIADLAAAKASLDTARLNLEFTRVVSPINGRVSKARITRGNLVTTTDVLTSVVSDGPIYASFNTDEQTYLRFASADRSKAGPVYLGLMSETGYPHVGKLQFIDNAMDAKSGTINGRAVFDNNEGKFTPGLFARIRLVSDQTETVGFVPDSAVGTDLGKQYVLVVGAGNKAEYRAVELGQIIDGVRVISKGLNPGDKIVVSGLQKVKPGQEVAPTDVDAPVLSSAIAPLGDVTTTGSIHREAADNSGPVRAVGTENGGSRQ